MKLFALYELTQITTKTRIHYGNSPTVTFASKCKARHKLYQRYSLNQSSGAV